MSAATNLRRASDAAIAEAAELIRGGSLVAFPTETVYGLGADATNDRAVAKIFEAKERPSFNPLITHVGSLESASQLGEFSEPAQRLARRFWPGGLTLVVPRREGCAVSLLVSAGLDTIALRVPAHPVAQALIAKSGVPISAPSANRSGEVSPTTADHVVDSLGNRVALILDGGPCRLGLESTVVGFTDGDPVLLRPGAIARETIEAITGPLKLEANDEGRPSSPGRLLRHYAPKRPLRLNAREVRPGEALLAFGTPVTGDLKQCLNLSPSSDLVEAAANLFAHLRALDQAAIAAIAVMPIPNTGLGEAINDRLKRAAAGTRTAP
jgi:L-threonylcarbamoyladenylate synthase